MTITLELPSNLHQKATVLATDCNQSLDVLLVGLIEESLARMTYRYPNGLASLAEEEPEFAAELAAWDALSDEALHLFEESTA